MQVIKRNGLHVKFDRSKIFNALKKCRDAVSPGTPDLTLNVITNNVVEKLSEFDGVHVEAIQDAVVDELVEYRQKKMTRAYTEYRYLHKIRRDASENLMATCKEIFFADAADVDHKRSNANINTDAPMGIMLNIGAETAKYFNNNYILPKEFADAHAEHFIHIHDQDFSLITLNCCQIDLLKLLDGGFSTGHGFVREPNSIRSAAALACIAVQANQNDMFGGQSINAFDYAMAKYVRKSFQTALLKEVNRVKSYVGFGDQSSVLRYACGYKNDSTVTELIFAGLQPTQARNAYEFACREVEEETHQAMEALIHNFNTLHSRAGAQVPFSSINYGMDTSPEGRLVTREVLNAINAGLGHGETAIFPISVFQLKSGVNYNPGDPNYDLFMLACKVSAKRLFPNFLSLDSTFNAPYYREGDYNSYVATMGKRKLSPSV